MRLFFLSAASMVFFNVFAQEKIRNISIQDFADLVTQKAPYIIPNTALPKLFLNELSAPKGWNTKYLSAVNTWFKTDVDQLQNLYNGIDFIDSRKKMFSTFTFNPSEALHTYPYPLLSYWDILPHPPIQKIEKPMTFYSKIYNNQISNPRLVNYFLSSAMDSYASEASSDNTLQVLTNNEVFKKKIELINNAKKYIFASNMFLTCDSEVAPILDALKVKISEGVKVYLILDRVFSLKYYKCFHSIKKMGVKIYYSNKFFKLNGSKIYHDKFWIFDGELALVYGANVIDAEVSSTGFNKKYRDTGVFIKGPLVDDLIQEYRNVVKFIKLPFIPIKFIDDIAAASKRRIEEQRLSGTRGKKLILEQVQNRGVCRLVMQGPHKDEFALTRLYYDLINHSDKSIFISMARMLTSIDLKKDYYTSLLIDLLVKKSLKNPEMNIDVLANNWLTPTDVESDNYTKEELFSKLYHLFVKVTDARLAAKESYDYFKPIIPSNFNLWHYFEYNHSKTLLVDNTISVIGSYNLNKNSAEKSFEMAIACNDQNMTNQLQHSVVLDLINSVPFFTHQ